MRLVFSEQTIILFSFFLISVFVTLPAFSAALLLCSRDWHILLLLLLIFRLKASIHEPVVSVQSTPPFYILLRYHENHRHHFLSCLTHLNYLLIAEELILHCVLQYELTT